MKKVGQHEKRIVRERKILTEPSHPEKGISFPIHDHACPLNWKRKKYKSPNKAVAAPNPAANVKAYFS
jgi:hypothetical protein